MNVYLQKLTQATLSYFDVSQNEPEKFYHGFVLGLLTSLQNRFVLTSNRESGLGRYEVERSREFGPSADTRQSLRRAVDRTWN